VKKEERFCLKRAARNHFKDSYNWFGRHPETVLAFLDKYMK
jgi:hypothetical protein